MSSTGTGDGSINWQSIVRITLSQVISNTATAVLVAPVALRAAALVVAPWLFPI